MDADAVIGRLYREVQERTQANDALIALITRLKTGEIALDRIAVTEQGITVRPQLEAVEATA